MPETKLDDFTRAYIEAALWSSTDDSGEPLDRNYGLDDIAPETLAKIVADCALFQERHGERIADTECRRGSGEYTIFEQAGHDFWLTRNGHGAGFWDGDWPESAGAELTTGSKAFGEINLYIGDDGKVYA